MDSEQKSQLVDPNHSEANIGLIVIGRNEGACLPKTLQALLSIKVPTIYVDSRSTDDSVEIARSLGFETLVLSGDKPVNASRARNEGSKLLLERLPSLHYLQFLDGDTEMDVGWLQAAIRHMNEHSEVGFVCGQLREKDRDSNVYRRLCDMEWRWVATDNAEPSRLGGMGLMRASTFLKAGGYDETLIAGADPELYGRLIMDGWRLHVVDKMMGVHDSGMAVFSQWWTRCVKAGFGFANGYADGSWHKEFKSALFWGGMVPMFCALASYFLNSWIWLGFLVLLYVVNSCRIWFSAVKREFGPTDRWLYAGSLMIMKIPQFIGIGKYYFRKWSRVNAVVIQYK